ncbi:putative RiPP precursor [Mesorhizobium sp. KR9-304]
MKKIYEKPTLVRRETLSKVTAGDGSLQITTA